MGHFAYRYVLGDIRFPEAAPDASRDIRKYASAFS